MTRISLFRLLILFDETSSAPCAKILCCNGLTITTCLRKACVSQAFGNVYKRKEAMLWEYIADCTGNGYYKDYLWDLLDTCLRARQTFTLTTAVGLLQLVELLANI